MVLTERFLLGALLVVALCATVNHGESNSTTTVTTPTTTTTENSPATTESDEAQKETNRTDGRTENARSLDLDISKYTSTDFHNKVYDLQTSPDNEKYVNHEISKVHTTFRTSFTSQNVNNFENYELSTPRSKLFDEKHKALQSEIKKRLEFEEQVQEQIEIPIDAIKTTNKTNLDFVRYSNVLSDEDVKNKTSIHRNYETEKGLNLNYESVYNQSDVVDKVHNDKNLLFSNQIENEKAINISKRGFTKSPVQTGNSTNEPIDHQPQSNLLPSIETNTNHEQTQQENNIYPVLVSLPLTTTSTTTETNTKLYEMTENDFATTTEFAYEVEASQTESDEKFYEMTETVSTTSIPDTETTTVNFTQNASSRTTTKSTTAESQLVATTTDVPTTTTTDITEDVTIGNITGTTDAIKITTELDSQVTQLPPQEDTSAHNLADDELNITTTITNDNLMTSISASTQVTTTDAITTTQIYFTSTLPVGHAETTTLSPNNESNEPFEVTTINPDPSTTEFVEGRTTTIPPAPEVTTVQQIVLTATKTITNESNAIIKEHNETETTSPPSPAAAAGNKIKKDNSSINEQNLDDFTEEFTDDDYIEIQNRKGKPVLPTEAKAINQTATEMEEILIVSTTVPYSTTVDEAVSSSEEIIEPETSNTGTIIAIVLSTVGAICLILLAILLFVMRRRQKRFNYGQRCTPVSLDAYSMDNVSVYNSVTRKAAMRSSKRSYGNPAFDDDTSVSHPLNFQAIIRFANNTEDIKAEFEEIPQVNAKMNELPDGCDTKNRYANIIPLPESRVYLTQVDDDPTSDYINANYVTGPKGLRGYYIACQAPLHNTVNDFWRMIWEQQSKVILMLTHLFENGVEKCVDYLPPSEVVDCHRLFGDYQVTLKKREVKDKYIISSLQLKNMVSNSWREVTHLWYSGWPEKGVPEEENSIIAFLIEARSYVKLVQNVELKENGISSNTSSGRSNQSESSPVVVHCSPGTGRTGSVIACDIAIREFELRRIVDIPRIVYRIRRDRASSVQTKDQYHFIYKVINLYATKLTGGALDSI